MTERIMIHRNPVDDGVYFQMNFDTLGKAVGSLKLCGLKLYLYLAANADGFTWTLYRQAYANWLGVPNDRTVRKMVMDGIEDLIANGFLEQIGPNNYNFYEDRHTCNKNDDFAKKQAEIVEKLEKDVNFDTKSSYNDNLDFWYNF